MKKNIVFWGAGNHGRHALRDFQNYGSKTEWLKGFYDLNKNVTLENQIRLSEGEIDWEQDIIIITCDNTNLVANIYETLKRNNVDDFYWYTGIKKSGTDDGFVESFCVSCSEWGNLILPQAEMHVVDYCNLNCKGCAHFSPLFSRAQPDAEKRIHDIEILASKFSYIIKFFLMGGEPFESPDICKYIVKVRRILPNTMIQIVTNGLLIPTLSKDILDAIRENDIVVSISEYKPTHKIIDRIENVLKDNGIRYLIRSFDTKQLFNKPLSISENSKYNHACISDGCVNIWEGKIARCPTLMYVDKFNETFGESLPNQGVFDLNKLSGREIIELMKQEVLLCKHCVENPIIWERCCKQPILTDFAEMD